MPSHELCDIQNEENAKLAHELRVGLKRLPSNKPYDQGRGPNPSFHDSGYGNMKHIVKKDKA